MSVLEAPATWIAAAAVLVVIAVVLIALAPRRRSGAASDRSAAPAQAAASGSPTASEPLTASEQSTVSAQPATADRAAASAGTAPAVAPVPAPAATAPRSSSGADDDAVTGPVLPTAARQPARTDAGADDDARTEQVPPQAAPRVAAAADEPVTAETPPMTVRERYVPVTDPARADGRAKDRLLAALLSDPTAAVDVVAAMPEGAPASGSAAAALLRAGLSPAQVAQVCGVEPGDLATLVARDLGLLGTARDGGAQRGRSRTEEPGRAWASAGSAAGSTTPTTG